MSARVREMDETYLRGKLRMAEEVRVYRRCESCTKLRLLNIILSFKTKLIIIN